jgi:hypothetical protein
LSELPNLIGDITRYANVIVPGLNVGVPLGAQVAAANQVFADMAKRGGLQSLDETGKLQPGVLVVPDAQLAKALGELREAGWTLAAQMDILKGSLDSGDVSKVQSGLAGCRVDSTKLASAIQLDRTTVTLQAGTAGTSMVSVTSGGTLPFSASVMDTPHKGISVEVLAGTRNVRVTATTETEAGSYQVRVADSTGAAALFTIKVEAKSAPAAPAGNGSLQSLRDSASPTCSGFNSRSRAVVCLVQKQVGATPDGSYGPNTCRAFRASRFGKDGLLNDQSLAEVARTAGLPDKPSDEAIYSKLFTAEERARCEHTSVKAQPPVPPAGGTPGTGVKGARTDLERKLSATDIGDFRAALGLPRTPAEFDDPFRLALSNFQAQRGLAQKNGDLDAATATELQKQPAKK